MSLTHDNNLRLTTWMLVVVLLLFWGQGALAGLGQHSMPMGEDSHRVMADGHHCHMPKMADLQCHCDTGHLNLRQALPQRDSDLLGFERIDRPVLVSKDLADLRPVRGPPRDEILFSFSAPPVPIPPRLSFCCLRI
ncbi:hypothetical protein Ga0074115_1519 [endosymbiont of Ridgeia piscesae]|jgi:hypothetical protein|uniref:Uncharacterized protein n=1 Tax=endosymbiont of Ridgeia piscesae TaxID=54398 RepID=A0A0T5Z0W6_9GAMM|nr:hypothetical protein [endosymbiont of Ridgeia piscesae]KRT56522.1 hypothetical protein Ga0074115_1519 [endosymbiont of Ridgeia piscesae]KRT57484.1 hypothetical protein Ga0076813_11642 [endosymbiont of Ridgeia piscesae]